MKLRCMSDIFDSSMVVCGIYIIIDKSGRVYIGSSVNVRQRLNDHRKHLKNNRHSNPYMQNVFNKYGIDYFDVAIIEQCTKSKLETREKYWIDKKCAYIEDGGFNIRKPYHGKMSEETKAKISKARKGQRNSIETIEKIRKARKGSIPWNKGLTKDDPRVLKHTHKKGTFSHSDETKNKIKQSKKDYFKNNSVSDETRMKLSISTKNVWKKRREQTDEQK